MDAGKAKNYDDAVSWLRIAHDIYLQHNRQADWQAYLAGLLDLHAAQVQARADATRDSVGYQAIAGSV